MFFEWEVRLNLVLLEIGLGLWSFAIIYHFLRKKYLRKSVRVEKANPQKKSNLEFLRLDLTKTKEFIDVEFKPAGAIGEAKLHLITNLYGVDFVDSRPNGMLIGIERQNAEFIMTNILDILDGPIQAND